MPVKILFDVEHHRWGRKEMLKMENFVVNNVHIEPGRRTPFMYNTDRENVFILLDGEGFIYLSKNDYEEDVSYGVKNGVVYKPVLKQIMYARKNQVFSLITNPRSKKSAHFLVIHDRNGREDTEI